MSGENLVDGGWTNWGNETVRRAMGYALSSPMILEPSDSQVWLCMVQQTVSNKLVAFTVENQWKQIQKPQAMHAIASMSKRRDALHVPLNNLP